MSRRTTTIAPEYFDALYARDADPWRFRTSAYEQSKYDDTLAILSRAHYGTALEVGCSIGVFTRRLASRCGRLVAMDASCVALAAAREALSDLPQVRFEQGAIPGDLPPESFDLIVLSEVLYYLDRDAASAAMRCCCDQLASGGEIVLCHWLGETDYPLTGDAAADLALTFGKAHGLEAQTLRRPGYRLDHLTSAPVIDRAGAPP